MQTGTHSIKVVFGNDTRLLVPLFQRPYVWQREAQWEPLWQDVSSVADRLQRRLEARPHFLGAIVLDQVLTPLGRAPTRMIVDGQQRLTTIQILLEAFADACASSGSYQYHDSVRRLTRNEPLVCVEPDDEFKVWPTNVDQHQYRSVMLAPTPAAVDAQSFPAPHLIADAYRFFHQQITDWLGPQGPERDERLKALYTALGDGLRMVVIYLDNDDDAQMIFETLNARGTPLLPSDLVKNYLLHRGVNEGERAETLYERYWHAFDRDASYWRKEIGVGRSKRARIDLYLQHYLTLKTRDEVPVGQLYTAFRQHANDSTTAKARDHLTSLHDYGQVYKDFDTYDAAREPSRKELFFLRLRQMDTTTPYPFLLELFARPNQADGQVDQVLLSIESFLVRRMVCHMTAKMYNRLFIEMIPLLDSAENELAARVRDHLRSQTADSMLWPDDALFRDAWLNSPLYLQIQRNRITMLLEALNRQLTTDRTERVAILSRLTIEHLMPQGWLAHWPIAVDLPADEARARRDKLIHTLGNLTLLTSSLNPAVSNGQWDQKRPAIGAHSALTLNRKLASEPEWQEWNEQAILRRAESLFRVATRIWPYPTP